MKPTRSVNFNIKEEALLISLAKKYCQILENKKTDSGPNRKKHDCYILIEKEFNSQLGVSFRSWSVLKKKYENFKKRTKQKFADGKQYLMGTGGGPPHYVEITGVD